MALASLFIRQSLSREFDSYVIAEQRASFVDDVGSYYATAGSWAGLDRWLRDQAARRFADASPATTDAPRRVGPRLRFVLVDSAGVVVVPFGRYTPGTTVDRSEITRGAPVTVDGQVVGTVITPDFDNIRNVAENRY